MAWTYMLRCADASFYVGSTRDLDTRMAQHASGQGARYTIRRLPVQLVWAVEVDRIEDAYAMEKRIQKWSRAKRLALIEDRQSELPTLSRSRYRRDQANPGHGVDADG